MSPAISTGIVGVQIALLLLALIIGIAAGSRKTSALFAWISTAMALAAIALAGAAAAPGSILGLAGDTASWIVYAVVSLITASITWGAVALVTARQRVTQERHYAKPETREAMAAELREVLRTEGIELDGRLKRAEEEREQFLFALEDRHAKQIAGLAQEYQHEAHTILRNLMSQLTDEQIAPMIDEQLEQQKIEIAEQLAKIDAEASGDALNELRAEYATLEKKVELAGERVAEIRAENPDASIEEAAEKRLKSVDAMIETRIGELDSKFDEALTARTEIFEKRLSDVDALLDEKVESAGNPLVVRMTETQEAVEEQLNSWMQVLEGRFAETEQLLGKRIEEQETALERRLGEIEQVTEGRLDQHVAALDSVLAQHDEQLQVSLGEQAKVIGEHAAADRDRIMGEMSDHAGKLQDQIANELVQAEEQARATVEATQQAWNVFTDELEARFEEARGEAMRAAEAIAEEERVTLTAQLEEITQGTSSDIAVKVEELGREAAWQRAQVERTVEEVTEVIQQRAKDALQNADHIFADLNRIGDERVDVIRRQAEEALVQSRDYVGQLQDSLGEHLEQLRQQSGVMADEMNDRLSSITATSQESAAQLEKYAHELVDATSQQLGTVAESAAGDLQQRINVEFTQTVEASLAAQQSAYEAHLNELAQRIMQQVQGDLAGMAEHARGAVTGELDQIISQARDHAQREQQKAFNEVMNDIARQQAELATSARGATDDARRLFDDGLRDNRRQLEEAMASMGAHMREELVRFHDEGQRRVDAIVNQLRSKEQDLVRDEDRRLTQARQELVRQHEGALQNQVRDLVGGLSASLGAGTSSGTSLDSSGAGQFTSNIERPATPLQQQTGPTFGA